MTSDDLTEEQADKVMQRVGHYLRYLDAILARMNRLSFPPDDPLYVATIHARNGAQQLYVAGHYAGCKHGVGRPSQEFGAHTRLEDSAS